jgi:hypothetical protein
VLGQRRTRALGTGLVGGIGLCCGDETSGLLGETLIEWRRGTNPFLALLLTSPHSGYRLNSCVVSGQSWWFLFLPPLIAHICAAKIRGW